jgi:hypothetical protein
MKSESVDKGYMIALNKTKTKEFNTITEDGVLIVFI